MTDDKIKKQAREINMLYKVNEEQKKEIERLTELIDIRDDACIDLVEEIKDLQRNINDLQSELAGATNDYKQATNEIKLLNKQIDRHITAVNDLTDIVDTSHKVIADLEKENNALKFRNKMLVKSLLNQLYGCCYVDTDSIKETKDNDSNY